MTRIQFELSEEKVKELEKLMEETGLRTKKDFLNNAITLFEWAVKERKAGHILASVDEEAEKYTEILMPSLSTVKPIEKERVHSEAL